MTATDTYIVANGGAYFITDDVLQYAPMLADGSIEFADSCDVDIERIDEDQARIAHAMLAALTRIERTIQQTETDDLA